MARKPLGEPTPMLVPGKQEFNKNLPLFLILLISKLDFLG